jgi:hypothetical protein
VELLLTLENVSNDWLAIIKQLPLEIKLKEVSSECYEADLYGYTHEELAKLLEALNNIGIAFLYKWSPANRFEFYQNKNVIPANAFKMFHQDLDGNWIIEERQSYKTIDIQREQSKPDIPYISSCEEFLVFENVSNDILEKINKHLLQPRHWYNIFLPIKINQIPLKKVESSEMELRRYTDNETATLLVRLKNKGECYQADLRKYTYKDRAKLLDMLNGLGFAFLYEWCPSAIFECYRSKGLLSGKFKLIFQNMYSSWIINEK